MIGEKEHNGVLGQPILFQLCEQVPHLLERMNAESQRLNDAECELNESIKKEQDLRDAWACTQKTLRKSIGGSDGCVNDAHAAVGRSLGGGRTRPIRPPLAPAERI